MADRVIAAQIQFNGITTATNSIAALRAELAKLRAEQSKTDPTSARYQELSQQIASVTSDLKDLETQQKATNKAFEETKLVAGSYAAIQAETKRLTEDLKKMSVGVNATQEEYDALVAKIRENNLQLTDMNREMRGSKSIAERFREGAVAAFKDVTAAILAGATALEGFNALQSLGQFGLDLERGFAQVNTVAQLSREELQALQDQVLETARNSSVELDQVPGALFRIISATGDVEESQKILESSLKAAKVGFTELNDAADAGTQIYGAVKNQVKDVDEVFDVLFRTQKEGVLTFADLAKNIPLVSSSAATLGVSFKETTAALATLTKTGLSADIATTKLKAGFTDLADAKKQQGLRDIGVNIFDAEGKVKSLFEIVQTLNKALDGLTDEQRSAKLAKVGFSQEAVGSVLTLTRNLETFGQVSQSIVDGSAGEFQRQFEASANTSDDLAASINDLKVELVQNLQPAFLGIGKAVVGTITGFSKLIGLLFEYKGAILLLVSAYIALNAAKVNTIVTTAAERLGEAAALVIDKARAIAIGIKTAATTAYGVAQQILTGRLTLAAAAQELLNLAMASNPIGLAIAGVTALAGALLLLSSRSREATEAEKRRAEIAKIASEASAAANEEIGRETAQLEVLVRGIRNENASKEEKARITDQLIKQYGQYLDDLDKEALKAGEVEVAYQKIKAAIIDTIVARQKSEAIDKLFGEQIARQREAAGTLAKVFNTTAENVLTMVEQFEKMSPEIQNAVSSGKGLQVLASDAANGFTELEKQTVKFFSEVEKNALKAGGVVGDTFEITPEKLAELNKRGAENGKIGVDILVNTIKQANDAIDQGLQDIDRQFGVLNISGGDTMTGISGGANDASESVKILKERIKQLQDEQENATDAKGWQDLQAEIDKVQRQIEAITGASSKTVAANKKAQKEIEKTADEQKDAAEKRAEALAELRRRLADLLVETEDEATTKLLKAEEERYAKEQQLALDNTAKITLDKLASQEEIQAAIQTQNAILEQLELDHHKRLNEIVGDGLEAELEQQRKADDERQSQAQRVLGLRLSAVQQEIQNEEKNFARRRQLIQLEKELRIKQLETETLGALRAAKTDEERTAIMEEQKQKRIGILKDEVNKVEDLRQDQGPILARLLGVSKEDAARFQQAFQEAAQVLGQAIEQFYQERLKALDIAIDAQKNRVELAANEVEQQVSRIQKLEERLSSTTGTRRQRLIALIEQERKREAELQQQKLKQEKQLAEIEEKKKKTEQEAAKFRKAQAIAQAVSNTAVGITKTIAEVPKADFGVTTAILIGLYAAIGAAQVALISAQKFAKGGKVEGPSHAQGGVKMAVPSQNRYVELEGGEYVVSKKATAKHLPLLEAINRDGIYERGGMVSPNFQAMSYAVSNRQSVAADQRFEQVLTAIMEVAKTPIVTDVRDQVSAQTKAMSRQNKATLSWSRS